MKTLLTLLSFLLISLSAKAQSLEGQWMILGNEAPEALVRFMGVEGHFFSHTQEQVVFPNGNLSHTIDQSVKLSVKEAGKIEGTVDFFDSRGCSFRDYKVSGEFVSKNNVNLVMTIPRYKLVTITTGPTGYYYDRPLYCWSRSPYYPYHSYRYICGYDRAVRNTRTECRLVDTVQVPVALQRY